MFKFVITLRKQSTENNSEAEIEKWNIDEHKFVEDVAHLDKRVYESERFQKVAGVDHGLTFVLIMEIDDMACPMNAGNAYMVPIINFYSSLHYV